jgi:hypothetical protein
MALTGADLRHGDVGLRLASSLAMAGVEVLEGAPRALKRKRRRSYDPELRLLPDD